MQGAGSILYCLPVTRKRCLTGRLPGDEEGSEAGLLTRDVFQRGECRPWRKAKGLSLPKPGTTEAGIDFTSGPTFPGRTAKRKLDTLIEFPVWSGLAAYVQCVPVSSREYQSLEEAQDPSGSPAFRKCLSFPICRKGKGRQEVSCHKVQSHAALTLSAAPSSSSEPTPLPHLLPVPSLPCPPCSRHSETKVRFLKLDPQARIQWAFPFSSISWPKGT